MKGLSRAGPSRPQIIASIRFLTVAVLEPPRVTVRIDAVPLACLYGMSKECMPTRAVSGTKRKGRRDLRGTLICWTLVDSRAINELGLRCMELWSVLKLFRKVGENGIPGAQAAVEKETHRVLNSLGPRATAASERIMPGFAADLVHDISRRALASARASIDAASLIFAHSILDHAVTECCRMSAQIAPDDWREAVAQRKVTVADLVAQPQQAIVDRMLAEYIEEMDRQPLLKRIDILNRQFQPAPPWSFRDEPYQFDRDRLKALDGLRHEVVHAVHLTTTNATMNLDLVFLEATSYYSMFILAHRYGLDFDPVARATSKLDESTSNPVLLAHRSLLVAESLLNELGDADKIWTYGNRVYFSNPAGKIRHLPILLPAAEPVLSPDGRRLVYIKSRPRSGDAMPEPDVRETIQDLWISNWDGSDARLLLPGGACKSMDAPERVPFLGKSLEGITAPRFSPDGDQIFFIADAWTTSGAIFVLEVATSRVRFFTDGNHFSIVETGAYRGHIITSKHRYWQFEAGYDPSDPEAQFGSYDHYWLVTPSGTAVKDLGDNLNAALAQISAE